MSYLAWYVNGESLSALAIVEDNDVTDVHDVNDILNLNEATLCVVLRGCAIASLTYFARMPDLRVSDLSNKDPRMSVA